MANLPLIGQASISMNNQTLITNVKVALKRTIPITTKKGAFGTIGSARGQPSFAGTLEFAVPATGLEFNLATILTSPTGFTINYARGVNTYMRTGCYVTEEDFNSDYEPGNTIQVINFIAGDEVQLT